ncbi:fatty acid desaturase family protein [Aestuariivivens sediminis]|uniref:fatty acid desaturase family protein n=1 Tax=Aestuariivivens sediminis TaxID=2913557 RepID=UPI001F5AEAB2|nr:fatty acid desaturase [Aestuariivivens sediminis]
MNKHNTISSNLKARDDLAFYSLLIPMTLLSLGVLLSSNNDGILYWTGQLLLSFFFLQAFILLHECAHLSFFKTRSINKVLGHVFGFLSMIPYYSWQQMHNLHHRWTGWRDKDPTTETTINPSSSAVKNLVVNITWRLFIPVFYLSYKLSNYWNLFKIKRFLSPKKYNRVKTQAIIYILIYILLSYFFGGLMVHIFVPAFAISLLLKELVIMTQHSHIEIPVSNHKEVKPLPYLDQVKYTRSFYIHACFTRYFLLNFNLHEAHHAHPAIPAYKLSKVNLAISERPTFISWFIKAKKMKGVDYIFKTSKHTGEFF